MLFLPIRHQFKVNIYLMIFDISKSFFQYSLDMLYDICFESIHKRYTNRSDINVNVDQITFHQLLKEIIIVVCSKSYILLPLVHSYLFMSFVLSSSLTGPAQGGFSVFTGTQPRVLRSSAIYENNPIKKHCF